PERVGLDGPQDHRQASIIPDHGALEPTLPDVTRGPVEVVRPPGVGDGERLEDSADRWPDLGPEQEVEVMGPETMDEEAERSALLGLGEPLKEGDAVIIVAKDVGVETAVARSSRAMDDGDRSSGTRHHPRASPRGISAQSANPATIAAPAGAPAKRRPVGRVK